MLNRLIKLLKEFEQSPEKLCPITSGNENCDTRKYNIKGVGCYDARRADYLLKHGVIASPCKVGDKVYVKNHEITINEVFLGEELLFSTYFDCDWVMENIGCEDCPFADWEQSHEGEWDCRTRGWFSFEEKDIGKTVFLTKEEAEQALRKEDKGK